MMTETPIGRGVVTVRREAHLVLPPRTFLYHLAPYRPESIWCESLTGYMNRLAWTHHVSPRVLIAEIISPRLPEPIPFVATFGLQPAMGLNGNGEQVDTWTNIVGQLTGRADLRHLTFAPYLAGFPSHKLLRWTPAWCPACLAEWKTAKQLLYQPLLWMFRLVTHCPIHQRPLVDRCPTCHKHQKVLATNKTRPSECTSCAAWLGEESNGILIEEDMRPVLSWQTWLLFVLEQLHAASLREGNLPWNRFFTHLAGYLKKHRAYSRLAHILGTGRENFHGWITHQDVAPQTLLSFCYRCEITPWQVMQGQFAPLDRVLREGTCRPAPLPPRLTRRFDRDDVLQQFLAVLHASAEPLSLNQVARKLGYATGLLTKYFPKESEQVLQQYGEYRNRRKEQRLQNLREDVRQAVFSLYARGEYPLRSKLGDEFFPNGAMRLSEAAEAWREAMVELGLDPDNQHKVQMHLTPKAGE